MKKALVIILSLLITLEIYAQAPKSFNYQGVARTSSGAPLVNKNISVRISILTNNTTGAGEYVEKHSVYTNLNGLFSFQVGSGTVISGIFNSIKWGIGLKFIKNEIDINGGSSYIELSTTQLLSVPFALVCDEIALNPLDNIINPLLLSKEYIYDVSGEITNFHYLCNINNLPDDAVQVLNYQVFKGNVLFKRYSTILIQDNGKFDVKIENVRPGDILTINGYIESFTGRKYTLTFSNLIVPAPSSIVLPTVSDLEVSKITYNTADVKGGLISTGNEMPSAKGVVYSLSNSPALGTNDSFTKISSNSNFTINATLVNLLSNTKYYARIFCTNSAGTAYSNLVSFTTFGDEICGDNIDNNGDGITDETPCKYGVEICGDNIDNNLDGNTDEIPCQ